MQVSFEALVGELLEKRGEWRGTDGGFTPGRERWMDARPLDTRPSVFSVAL
jgi:hypothetical protein